jgi:hypothetical protein
VEAAYRLCGTVVVRAVSRATHREVCVAYRPAQQRLDASFSRRMRAESESKPAP